jgi:NAD(P)-dependent dehydrogenase (short-subunit alcohol dehydrogenase family)
MEPLRDRVAVVTGAASGIGFALAQRCAAGGMKVVLADVEQPALDHAEQTLRATGATTLALQTDVSIWEEVEALADAAYRAFGAVHLLCNNAGVAGTRVRAGGIWERSLEDWRWILEVNLWGVIHGARAFLPRMLAGGDEGHILNTASLAALAPGSSIYSVSKHAVLAFTEALYLQLRAAGAKIGASALCPGVVRTSILDAERNRPPHLRSELPAAQPEIDQADEQARRQMAGGMSPSEVAAAAFDGIRNGRLFIVVVPAEQRPRVEETVRRRAERLVRALNQPA